MKIIDSTIVLINEHSPTLPGLYRYDGFINSNYRCNNKYLQDGVLLPRTIEEFVTNIGEYDTYNCTLLLQVCIAKYKLSNVFE